MLQQHELRIQRARNQMTQIVARSIVGIVVNNYEFLLTRNPQGDQDVDASC